MKEGLGGAWKRAIMLLGLLRGKVCDELHIACYLVFSVSVFFLVFVVANT